MACTLFGPPVWGGWELGNRTVDVLNKVMCVRYLAHGGGATVFWKSAADLESTPSLSFLEATVDAQSFLSFPKLHSEWVCCHEGVGGLHVNL